MKKFIVIIVVLLLLGVAYIALDRAGYLPEWMSLRAKSEAVQPGHYTVDQKVSHGGRYFIFAHTIPDMKEFIFEVNAATFADVKETFVYSAEKMNGWKPVKKVE